MSEFSTQKLSNRRRWLLLVNGLGFAVWWLSRLSFLTDVGLSQGFISITELLGAGVFMASTLLMIPFTTRGKLSNRAFAVLNDELVQRNRSRAFTAGYFATIITVAALHAFDVWFSIATRDALILALVAGICSAIFTFAHLESRGE